MPDIGYYLHTLYALVGYMAEYRRICRESDDVSKLNPLVH
jgi:hypothetical protein